MTSKPYDVAIIGAGIVGLATARALAGPVSVVVLEAESGVAAHQTGHNSGVIHAGLYYKPGSQKAHNCAAGREEMYRFCADNGVAHERCGKLVVAGDHAELARLDELERRGMANGLEGLTRLSATGLTDHEPEVRGVGGLWVRETGIVDYRQVAAVMAAHVRERGGDVHTGQRVRAVERRSDGFVLRSAAGSEVQARALVNCAGLQSDRVARMCGLRPALRIIPFRGEYYRLAEGRTGLVRNLIYPVPDPRFPFLGVHFTRMIHGGVEAGPNAVLALKREGYRWSSISPRDLFGALTYPGFWRMAARHWKTGIAEVHRSLRKSIFVRDLRKLVPALGAADVERHGAGVRAQAVGRDGALLDDFHILEAERMLHVLNAPSPAATASLAIGRTLAERATALFRL